MLKPEIQGVSIGVSNCVLPVRIILLLPERKSFREWHGLGKGVLIYVVALLIERKELLKLLLLLIDEDPLCHIHYVCIVIGI